MPLCRQLVASIARAALAAFVSLGVAACAPALIVAPVFGALSPEPAIWLAPGTETTGAVGTARGIRAQDSQEHADRPARGGERPRDGELGREDSNLQLPG